jgi:hypothetical protein
VLLRDNEPAGVEGTIAWEDPEGGSSEVALGAFRAYLIDMVGAVREQESIDFVGDTTQSTPLRV